MLRSVERAQFAGVALWKCGAPHAMLLHPSPPKMIIRNEPNIIQLVFFACYACAACVRVTRFEWSAFFVNACAIKKKKKAVPNKLMYEPYDAIAFQSAYASGKSGIRRGIPANPKKCIGKNVTFAPMNVIQKCIFPKLSEYGTPIIFSNQ